MAVVLFSFIVYLIYTSESVMQLTLLDQSTTGKCMDGTPGGYYYETLNTSSTTWVIFLQGGGHCATKSECDGRVNSALGSSKYFSSTINGAHSYSTSSTENPDFYNAHHIFIPYCSSDWFSGLRTQVSDQTWGYYFSGHLIVDNILSELFNKYNFKDAKNVLLTGESAGGIGTILNANYLKTKLIKNGVNNNANIRAAPVAGWFFPGNTTDQINYYAPPNDYPDFLNGTNGGFGHTNYVPNLWDSYLDNICINALNNLNVPQWNCFSANNLYTYINIPIFILENKYDSDQITYEMEMPNTVNDDTKKYVEYYGENMQKSILYQIIGNNVGNGVFLASCYDHVTGLDVGYGSATTKVNGYTSGEIVGDWFWNRNKYNHIIYDTCTDALPCNPTCHGF